MKRALAAAASLAAAALLAGCSSLPGWMILQGRSMITDHQHFDNAPIAAAATPRPLPEAPAPLPWPDGMDDAAAARWLAEQGTVALLVLRRGQLVAEHYFHGYQRDSLFTSFSAAKSVVSLMVGLAIADGRIASVDEPITRQLPELLANDARFGQITLRHLLAMRSGIAFDESYNNPFAEAGRFYLRPDLLAEVARLKIAGPPDQAYHYSSGDTQLLAMAVQRAVGQPFARYVEQRLWQPMGAAYPASWSLDSAASGVVRGFCCLNARAVDYARLGQLVLDGGLRDGRAVLPADWLRQSTAAQQGLPGADDAARRNIERRPWASPAFYAWQWRRLAQPSPPGLPSEALQPGATLVAQGLHGQYIVIVPQADAVVVRLGRDRGPVNWPRWLERLALGLR